MNWKAKSVIQNVVAALPKVLSYRVYFYLQRKFGGFKHPDIKDHLLGGMQVIRYIQDSGATVDGRVFLEVGTGRAPILPIAYWLAGASEIITVDLNPYLREDLTNEVVRLLAAEEDLVREIFGTLLNEERWQAFLGFATDDHRLPEILDFFCCRYVAPGDAANTNIPDNYIDFHVSHNVMEHVPKSTITGIFLEGNRIIKETGLFVHKIDYSDHFSHSDSRISDINFLQYSDRVWRFYAGNRFMYMNRLRHDDFLEIYDDIGHHIVECQPRRSPSAKMVLEFNRLRLSEEFRKKDFNVLEITGAWIISSHPC